MPPSDVIEVISTPTTVVEVVTAVPAAVEVISPVTDVIEVATGPPGPMRPDVVTSPDLSILTVKAMTQEEFDATAPHPSTQLTVII